MCSLKADPRSQSLVSRSPSLTAGAAGGHQDTAESGNGECCWASQVWEEAAAIWRRQGLQISCLRAAESSLSPLTPAASGIMLGGAGPAGRRLLSLTFSELRSLSLSLAPAARVPTVWVVSAEGRAWAALGVVLGLFCRDEGMESTWMVVVNSLPRSLPKTSPHPM